MNCKDIDGWKIVEKKVMANELFFIKKDLDMNRVKDVHHFTVTVYKNFEEDGEKFKGSSDTQIHSTMNEAEIRSAIEGAAFAAKFVKNKYYPLARPVDRVQPQLKSNFSELPFSEWMPRITDGIFKADVYDKGWINSAELFLN
jgi:PmbA protein